MAETNLAPGAIVTELLTSTNYHNWKVWLKNYLFGQDLWGIIDESTYKPRPSQAEFKTWKMKNAKALHAIQISCAPEMFSHIKYMDSAKDAWEQLASMYPETSEEMATDELNEEAAITEEDHTLYLPLYKALDKGDWKCAKSFLDVHPKAASVKITTTGETALHIAAVAGRVNLVTELLKLMPPEALEIKCNQGNAAISLAAIEGTTEIAKLMVRKNSNVVRLRNQYDLIPLVVTAINGNKDMMIYLYSVTPIEELSPDSGVNGATFLTSAILADIYDNVVLDLLKHYPKLATTPDSNGATVLSVLAGKPSAFPSGSRHVFWQRWIYSCINLQVDHYMPEAKGSHGGNNVVSKTQVMQNRISQVIHYLQGLVWTALKLLVPGVKQIHDKKMIHVQVHELLKVICPQISILNVSQLIEARVYDAIFLVTSFGIIEFFIELINSNPHLIYCVDSNDRGLFQEAVLSRQEKIFNYICQLGQKKDRAIHWDKFGNNLLHVAGFLAPSSQLDRVSGAALQMQRELQWFQEVEKVVQPKFKELTNDNDKKPRALFTEEHRALVKQGEMWMKETAQACMVVATLIATVMFAAAFTVPGGNNQETGFPIFLNTRNFDIFIVSDAISLFSSCTSVLMFLAILTARYAEEDFLRSLPQKLILGLASLFISIAAMMVAFGTTLVIVLHKRFTWVAIPVTLLASVPIALFALLQFPLFMDIIFSTYGSGIFHK